MLAMETGSRSVEYSSATDSVRLPMEISPKPAPARKAIAREIMSRTEAGTLLTPSPAPGADS